MLQFYTFWWHFELHCGTLCYVLALLALSGSFGTFRFFFLELTAHFLGSNNFVTNIVCVKFVSFCMSAGNLLKSSS